jgi:hypothetical protein
MNGKSLRPALSDRRVWLFAAATLASCLTGFVLVPDASALHLVTSTGYWCVLAGFVGFVWSLWRTYRADLERIRAAGLRGFDWASAAVVGIGGMVLLVHESFGFKIVMDELMLLGTSLNMHLTRTVAVPFRGGNIQGAFTVFEGVMDKRQLFFPFLESLLHDVTGYRPENAFVLNGALTFIFLGLVFAFGKRVAGRRAGWLGVALFAGLPLLAQNATGGGFELLNLVMILAAMMTSATFVERRDAASFTALCFTAMLLAQVRYESAVFLLPVAGIILWVWREEGRAEMPWSVILIPPLMIHCALHTRIFDIRASAWQMLSKPEYSKPFSAAYIPGNLGHAAAFFFGKSTDQPNSIVLSVLGCLALAFFLLLVSKRVASLRTETPISVITVFFAVGFIAHFLLMMCYFWGQFDDAVIRRLSLPTNLLLVVATLAVLPQFPRPAVVKTLLGVVVLGILVQGVPSMASHAYSQLYLPGLETEWRRQFIRDHPAKDYLVIDNDSILWVAHEVSATTVEAASKRSVDLAFFMKTHSFSDIFVFQRYNVDPDTGKMTLREGDDLGPDYVLETVRAERLMLLTQTRISRLVEIRDGKKGVISTPAPEKVVPKDQALIDKEREAYLENFLRRLP